MKRLLLLLFLASCAHEAPSPSASADAIAPSKPESEVRAFASGARARRTARLLTYTSKPWGFDTNSHFLVGPTGLVMIGTQFLPSATEEAVSWAEAETGLSVVLAVVLHPNPDKFNGTKTLQDRGVRVVTSEAVAARIPAVHEKRTAWFLERYAPDYPTELPAPSVVETGLLEAAGLRLKLHALEAGCSEAHLVVEHERRIFVDDLVASGTHAWLELGHLEAWKRRIDELAVLEPTEVHVGRGPSGGPELLAAHRAYLERVGELTQKAIEAAADPARPAESELSALRQQIVAEYPSHGYEVFLRLGLPAVWEATFASAAVHSEAREAQR